MWVCVALYAYMRIFITCVLIMICMYCIACTFICQINKTINYQLSISQIGIHPDIYRHLLLFSLFLTLYACSYCVSMGCALRQTSVHYIVVESSSFSASFVSFSAAFYSLKHWLSRPQSLLPGRVRTRLAVTHLDADSVRCVTHTHATSTDDTTPVALVTPVVFYLFFYTWISVLEKSKQHYQFPKKRWHFAKCISIFQSNCIVFQSNYIILQISVFIFQNRVIIRYHQAVTDAMLLFAIHITWAIGCCPL